jgi:hypothetical protein
MPNSPSKKRRNQLDPVGLARKIVDQVTGTPDRRVGRVVGVRPAENSADNRQ